MSISLWLAEPVEFENQVARCRDRHISGCPGAAGVARDGAAVGKRQIFGGDGYAASCARSRRKGCYGAEVGDRQRAGDDDDVPRIAASARVCGGQDAGQRRRSRSIDRQQTGDIDGYIAAVAGARRCGPEGTDGAVEDLAVDHAQLAGINGDASGIPGAAGLHACGNAGQERPGASGSVDLQRAGDIEGEVAAVAGAKGRTAELAGVRDRQGPGADRQVAGLAGAARVRLRFDPENVPELYPGRRGLVDRQLAGDIDGDVAGICRPVGAAGDAAFVEDRQRSGADRDIAGLAPGARVT